MPINRAKLRRVTFFLSSKLPQTWLSLRTITNEVDRHLFRFDSHGDFLPKTV